MKHRHPAGTRDRGRELIVPLHERRSFDRLARRQVKNGFELRRDPINQARAAGAADMEVLADV
jgi:hypothetical protein